MDGTTLRDFCISDHSSGRNCLPKNWFINPPYPTHSCVNCVSTIQCANPPRYSAYIVSIYRFCSKLAHEKCQQMLRSIAAVRNAKVTAGFFSFFLFQLNKFAAMASSFPMLSLGIAHRLVAVRFHLVHFVRQFRVGFVHFIQ